MKNYEVESETFLYGRFTNWLDTCLYRKKLKYLRRMKQRISIVSFEDYPEYDLIPDSSFEKPLIEKADDAYSFDFTNKALEKAYYNLSAQRQRVLLLIYAAEKSTDEIAKIFDCTVQHIYNMHSLSLRQLREELTTNQTNHRK